MRAEDGELYLFGTRSLVLPKAEEVKRMPPPHLADGQVQAELERRDEVSLTEGWL